VKLSHEVQNGFNSQSITRAYYSVIRPKVTKYGLSKRNYTINAAWNSLPESVISARTTDSFKNKLDKFWSDQDIILITAH